MASAAVDRIEIGGERESDVPGIRSIHTDAFAGPIEAQLVDSLRTRDAYGPALSVVARKEGEVVGHVLFYPLEFTAVESPIRALSLAPIAVRSDLQGQGIGSSLIHEALARAWASKFDLILVLGDPAYYGRFGFRAAMDCEISAPYSGTGHAFQALAREKSLKCAGQAHYPPEFDGV